MMWTSTQNQDLNWVTYYVARTKRGPTNSIKKESISSLAVAVKLLNTSARHESTSVLGWASTWRTSRHLSPMKTSRVFQNMPAPALMAQSIGMNRPSCPHSMTKIKEDSKKIFSSVKALKFVATRHHEAKASMIHSSASAPTPGTRFYLKSDFFHVNK